MKPSRTVHHLETDPIKPCLDSIDPREPALVLLAMLRVTSHRLRIDLKRVYSIGFLLT